MDSPCQDRQNLCSRKCLHSQHSSQGQSEETYFSAQHAIRKVISAPSNRYGTTKATRSRRDSPLIPANTVELPTLVNPKLAFTVQFAANQTIQNVAANFAVSAEVNLSESPPAMER